MPVVSYPLREWQEVGVWPVHVDEECISIPLGGDVHGVVMVEVDHDFVPMLLEQ